MSFASLRLGPRVPAARAPHARPPPCYLRLARVMKAPPRPLSQKRAAEGLQGRVRRARVYVLSPAAGAARRSTPLPLRGPRASLERFTHYSDGFYGVFLPENVQNPCCSVAVEKGVYTFSKRFLWSYFNSQTPRRRPMAMSMHVLACSCVRLARSTNPRGHATCIHPRA